MTLKDALGLLIKRNPALAREKLTIQQAQQDLLAARGAFSFDLDLNLNLSRSLSLNNFFQDLGLDVDNLLTEDLSLLGSVGLSKRFSMGTVLSFFYDLRYSFNDPPPAFNRNPLDPNPPTLFNYRGNSQFRIQVVQPLLKGAWFAVNLAPIWQAKEQVQIARLRTRLTTISSVAQVEQAYWDLVYARRDVDIKQAALKLAQTQLQNTRALIKAGKLAALERYQVLQVVAARQGELLVARDGVTRALAQLRVLLFLPANTRLIPSDPPELSTQLPSAGALLKEALRNHPQIAIARKQLKISKWSVLTAKNATLPQLNFTASFTFIGAGFLQVRQKTKTDTSPQDHNPVSPIGTAFQTLFDPKFHRFFIGFNMSIPLDNREATSKHVRHRLEVQRATLEIKRVLHQIRQDIAQYYIQATRAKARIATTKKSVFWAKKKLEAEQQKLSLGQTTLFQVLTFQQDLANARLSALRAMIDYRKALVLLHEKAGRLLKHHGISASRR